jgi:hypothetical protein
MMLTSSLPLVALAACLVPPDVAALPAPQLPQRWAEAIGLHLLNSASGYHGPRPESVEMLDAAITGKMGMHQGWWHPSRARLDWNWLAERMDRNRDGRVERAEFQGPSEFFARLDHDEDGTLSAADFDWRSLRSEKEQKKEKGGAGPGQATLLAGLVSGEVGSPYEGPRPGQSAPLFTLATHDGKGSVKLADELERKPVVLIFGSIT